MDQGWDLLAVVGTRLKRLLLLHRDLIRFAFDAQQLTG
jgi:hypothetical protein